MLGGPGTAVAFPSIVGAGNRAAQSGPASFVTTDAAGNIATSPFTVDELLGRVAGAQQLARETRREARQGVAAAMAMSAAPMPSAPGRTSWAVNTAAFRGEWALGAALAHRLDTQIPVAITAGYAYGGSDSHGVRVGLQGEF